MTPGPETGDDPFEWLNSIAGEEVEAILSQLPDRLRAVCEWVAIVIEPFPDESVVREMGDADLLGLFSGEVATALEFGGAGPEPARIHLYTGNLFNAAGDQVRAFRREVRKTFLHELGHYLELDEDELTRRGMD